MTVFETLELFKKRNFSISIEEERELFYEYIYTTNKLEGNALSLVQTKEVLENNLVSGQHVKMTDILEQKGMYKALKEVIRCSQSDFMLSVDWLINLNWLILGDVWKDETAYFTSKSKGQKYGELKSVENIIQIQKRNGEKLTIKPLSQAENVKSNLELLISQTKHSQTDVISTSVRLAREIWLHQPFIDGNKRMGRLLISLMTMRAGFPLFTYDDRYNDILVEQYVTQEPNLLEKYIEEKLNDKMNFYLTF
jgi:Fic family protein